MSGVFRADCPDSEDLRVRSSNFTWRQMVAALKPLARGRSANEVYREV